MVSEVNNNDSTAADTNPVAVGTRAGQDLTIGPEHHHVLRLTGFMLLGFVAVMGANLIETLYIGKVGTQELAALFRTVVRPSFLLRPPAQLIGGSWELRLVGRWNQATKNRCLNTN